MIQCTIKRDKTGMGRLYPKYYMHLTNGYQFLMVAKKRAINNTSNYIVSMNRRDPEKKNGDFLGKVRSNFLGTEFTLYDSGENPSKTKMFSKMRCELGIVLYESNLLGAKGPRKMKVMVGIDLGLVAKGGS
jgi:tubby and related proteins